MDGGNRAAGGPGPCAVAVRFGSRGVGYGNQLAGGAQPTACGQKRGGKFTPGSTSAMSAEPVTGAAPAPAFVTTRWTQVLSARGESPEARAALGELCEAYWMPVFRFIRRGGRDEDAARDLTQGFLAQLLARNGLDTVEPGKGRFRSYLLGAVKHYLADQFDRSQAA